MSTERTVITSKVPDEDRLLVRLAESFSRTGMDATGILDLIAAWLDSEFKPGDYSDVTSARFRSKLTEHGVDVEKLRMVIGDPDRFPHRAETEGHRSREVAERMASVRAAVGRLLSGTGAEHGEIGNGRSRERITHSTGETRARITRRLNRDRPDLAEAVASRQITAHAAAIEAGYRRRRVSVPMDNPAAVVKSLRTHMEPDALVELLRLLADALQDVIEQNRGDRQ